MMIPSDPEERQLFFMLLSSPDSADVRTRYRAFLESRADRRAELFAIADALASTAAHEAAALRARLTELLLVPRMRAWWGYVGRTDLRHCGAARSEDALVRFKFRCPQVWEALEPTADPRVRSCSACKESVHFCATADEVAERARQGQCVAVERVLVDGVFASFGHHITGRPDYDAMWAERVFGREE